MINLPSPQGVLFDLDGTLLDSETLARQCFLAACADIGFEPDVAVYNRCVGSTEQATEQIMRAEFGPDFDFESMQQRWSVHYHAYLDQQAVALKPGVRSVLETLQTRQIPMAVVTSSMRPTVEKKLHKAGLAHFFELYVCGGEAASGKPDPHPYLKALSLLGLAPQVCWGIEDSDNGTRASLAAGMVTFQIPDAIPPGADMRASGHPILASMDDLLPYLG